MVGRQTLESTFRCGPLYVSNPALELLHLQEYHIKIYTFLANTQNIKNLFYNY